MDACYCLFENLSLAELEKWGGGGEWEVSTSVNLFCNNEKNAQAASLAKLAKKCLSLVFTVR